MFPSAEIGKAQGLLLVRLVPFGTALGNPFPMLYADVAVVQARADIRIRIRGIVIRIRVRYTAIRIRVVVPTINHTAYKERHLCECKVTALLTN